MADQDRDAQDKAGDAQNPQAGSVAPAPTASLSARGASRRRFAKASAGATGVLLTLHSQPGMACTYCGISPSLAVSAINQKVPISKLSHHGPAPVCNGKMPWWWADQGNWPRGCDPDAPFKKYFSCGGRSAPFAEVSARKILAGAPCDAGLDLGKFILASYLNAVSGRVNFLSVQSLQQVWGEWNVQGYYAPMAGQKWYPSDIVGYLYGTMD